MIKGIRNEPFKSLRWNKIMMLSQFIITLPSFLDIILQYIIIRSWNARCCLPDLGYFSDQLSTFCLLFWCFLSSFSMDNPLRMNVLLVKKCWFNSKSCWLHLLIYLFNLRATRSTILETVLKAPILMVSKGKVNVGKCWEILEKSTILLLSYYFYPFPMNKVKLQLVMIKMS